ncbi:MAG: DUF3791 domain-containing protein [Lachnospiraceae bacterium]
MDISSNELEFMVFCIENTAQALGISGDETYRLLTKQNDILFHYILSNYDILHTQSKEYIISDIIEYMHEKGVIR